MNVTRTDALDWVRRVLRGDVESVGCGHHWVKRNGQGSILISDATLALIAAADEIERLRALLKRIDAVTTWETTPLGRHFQDEVEAALQPAPA